MWGGLTRCSGADCLVPQGLPTCLRLVRGVLCRLAGVGLGGKATTHAAGPAGPRSHLRPEA